MADFECDTDRLRSDGEQILEYVKNIETDLDNFFNVLDNLEENEVWKGDNCLLYRNRVRQEKPAFLKFSNGLKEIGNKMVSYSDSLDNLISSNEREFDN